jgi:hypothetical protein
VEAADVKLTIEFFVRQVCHTRTQWGKASSQDLYDCFCLWCEDHNVEAAPRRKFGLELSKMSSTMGFKRHTHSVTHYEGLTIRHEWRMRIRGKRAKNEEKCRHTDTVDTANIEPTDVIRP